MTEKTTSPSATATSADDAPAHRYTASLANTIEPHWQEAWDQAGAFEAISPQHIDFDPGKPKYYVLDMFPYPSGAGLHVGHPEGYTATDIVARFKRLTGHNVLHPMGWDAFGLPAEQYAIQTGVHPARTTREAIDNFRRQLKRFGFSYDWTREFATIDEDYYRWTQWIWLQAYNAWYDHAQQRARPIEELILELENGNAYVGPAGDLVQPGVAGKTEAFGGEPIGCRKWHELDEADRREFLDNQRLAYLDKQVVNWCPKLGTALANEEVIDGRSERGGFPVHRKPLRQWMFRITAFADRLLSGLAGLQWPESTRTMQAQWIGRSEGAEIDFDVEHGDGMSLRVFTTRPDTIFGATFMVVAPEHPLIDDVLSNPRPETEIDAVRDYVKQAVDRSEVERMADTRDKTGVFTGAYAINPASGMRIAIWVADYVLISYGTGAIMAVPAHDDRDYEFAKKFDLPIIDVVYQPVHHAIHECCRRIIDHEKDLGDTDEIARVLTDFVGLAMNQNRTDWDAMWQQVCDPRAGDDEDAEMADLLGLRGSVSIIWEDSIRPLISSDARAFVEAAARYHLASQLSASISDDGTAINSHNDSVSIDGLETEAAKKRIIDWFEQEGVGQHKVTYKLRDWLFSRQRYWGEPFPIVFDEKGNHYPVSEANLPVVLPDMADYTPVESDDPQPLLAKAGHWVQTTAGEAGVDPDVLPPDTPVRRETNTMPGWAGSCWYHLRYCDRDNEQRFVGIDAERYWLGDHTGNGGGVDLYIGGAEHAVLHLLYARFWHKLLHDLGHVSTDEPYRRLFHQGLIQSHAFQDSTGRTVPIDEVEQRDGSYHLIETGEEVTQIVAKMSKTLKNVVNPDEVIAEFGADTFRLYEMYMGPLEAAKPWNTRDIVGPFRFLQRVWRLAVDQDTGDLRIRAAADADAHVEKQLHRMIAKVGDDIDRLSFNTAIAAMIEFTNTATSSGGLTADQLQRFLIVLSPFAPHIAEELWHRAGNDGLVMCQSWPGFDDAMLHDDEIELPVQIMGKVRGRIMVPADADQQAIEQMAMNDDHVSEMLEGKTIRKVIVVPGKIINIVAN